MKKLLKKLGLASYKKDNLDEKKLERTSARLNRQDLKVYIKEIKNYEKKKNVYISLPYPPSHDEEHTMELLFPNKKISYIIDPSLGVGLQITNNDLITEMNLKDTLESILAYTTEDYD